MILWRGLAHRQQADSDDESDKAIPTIADLYSVNQLVILKRISIKHITNSSPFRQIPVSILDADSVTNRLELSASPHVINKGLSVNDVVKVRSL